MVPLGTIQKYMKRSVELTSQQGTAFSKKRGRPPALSPDQDKKVLDFITGQRLAGACVNCENTAAAARAILQTEGKRHTLQEFGGTLILDCNWGLRSCVF